MCVCVRVHLSMIDGLIGCADDGFSLHSTDSMHTGTQQICKNCKNKGRKRKNERIFDLKFFHALLLSGTVKAFPNMNEDAEMRNPGARRQTCLFTVFKPSLLLTPCYLCRAGMRLEREAAE